MKYTFVFIGILLASCTCLAEQAVQKVPFLPYAGVSTYYYPQQGSYKGTGTRPFSKQPIRKAYESIFFEPDSAEIRGDQYEKVKRLATRLSREGSGFYSVVAYTTPEIDLSIARARVKTMTGALEDFGIKERDAIVSIEHKEHPVLNPHRVDVYMRALEMGSTIRK